MSAKTPVAMKRAHHFLGEGLVAGSGSEPPWTVGETRSVRGRLKLCRRGYHHSPSWLDALRYAPGPVACLVEVSVEKDPELSDADKGVSRTRTLLAAADATRELRLFAADCAERGLLRERERGREPDPRSWAAITAARDFANGRIDSDALAAALAAAWRAAWAAVWAAAWAAARDAALAAAWRAAWGAAWGAAWAAERHWQHERLAFYLAPLFATVAVRP